MDKGIDNIATILVDYDLSAPFVKEAYRNDRVIGIDIETSGLDYINDKIATVQVYVPDIGVEVVRIYDGQPTPANIHMLLEDSRATKVFHYGMFDLSFLMQRWGMFARNVMDTRIAATLIDPFKTKFYNPTRGKYDHGLASLVWTYYQDRLDKELAISDWFGELTPAQINYASKDVIYLPLLIERLHSEMAYRIRQAASSAYAWLPGKVFCKVQGIPDPTERV